MIGMSVSGSCLPAILKTPGIVHGFEPDDDAVSTETFEHATHSNTKSNASRFMRLTLRPST